MRFNLNMVWLFLSELLQHMLFQFPNVGIFFNVANINISQMLAMKMYKQIWNQYTNRKQTFKMKMHDLEQIFNLHFYNYQKQILYLKIKTNNWIQMIHQSIRIHKSIQFHHHHYQLQLCFTNENKNSKTNERYSIVELKCSSFKYIFKYWFQL
jgi:hypothetical protein